ncbi:hypothetical protein [Corynebacterium glutamicum]|uniref:hypothetical protein n=1 Tax=Corynebacterium glutamicum TaxID=1718 RepID=UPI00058A5C0E|nr:hypothetical protein [Corynebacterium glutamicum]AJE66450.1 hypothetical protein SB89_02170 [Corynebacterium glutamicum]OKX90837.1 hypothetical protein AUP72_09110 [Corynebacterium glutamicum]TWS33427.1 hypothetical protein AKJ21_12030 [Corynebacterium glutamicum]
MKPIRFEDVQHEMNRRQFSAKYTRVVGTFWIKKEYAENPVVVADALLRRFPNGVIRGFTALIVRGYSLLDEPRTAEISVPRGASHVTVLLGKVVRHKMPEVHVVKGRCCVSVAQALLDEFPAMVLEQQVALVDHLVRQNEDLYKQLQQVKALKEMMRLVNPMAESRPESMLRVRLRREGIWGFEPQIPVECDGVTRFVDLGNPKLRIALEYQGAVHFEDAEKRSQDSRRVNELRAAGWVVIEVTWPDLADQARWGRLLTELRKQIGRAEEERKMRRTPIPMPPDPFRPY